MIPADLVDAGSMVEAVKISEPDEIYHLAAQSFVGASFEQNSLLALQVKKRFLSVMKNNINATER